MKYFLSILCGVMLAQIAYAQSSSANAMPDVQ